MRDDPVVLAPDGDGPTLAVLADPQGDHREGDDDEYDATAAQLLPPLQVDQLVGPDHEPHGDRGERRMKHGEDGHRQPDEEDQLDARVAQGQPEDQQCGADDRDQVQREVDLHGRPPCPPAPESKSVTSSSARRFCQSTRPGSTRCDRSWKSALGMASSRLKSRYGTPRSRASASTGSRYWAMASSKRPFTTSSSRGSSTMTARTPRCSQRATSCSSTVSYTHLTLP